MSFGWLTGLVRLRGRPGGRRRMAGQALRQLSDEIKADTLAVERIDVREILCNPDDCEPEPIMVVWVKTRRRPEVTAWLEGTEIHTAPPEVRTDWILLPRTPEAVVIATVAAGPAWPAFRFNLRIPGDRFRRHLRALARSGVIGLTLGPLELGEDHRPVSRCVFVAVETQPLRDFLRELPPVPVV